MKKIILLIPLFLIFGALTLEAQTTILEKEAKSAGISLNIPASYTITDNREKVYPAEITDEFPLPDIAQQYGVKPSQGNTFFNALFGMISATFEHNDQECIVLAYITPGRNGNNFGRISNDSVQLEIFNHIYFGRIKHDFRYGKPFSGASALDALELYPMLTRYPSKKAGNMFNAAAMVSYPLNFRGNVFKEKFTRGKGTVIGKDGLEVYLYFLMTDQSVLKFNKYLDEFNGAFVFK